MLKSAALLPDLLSDYHVHTRLRSHAGGDMEDCVLAAMARGLRC